LSLPGLDILVRLARELQLPLPAASAGAVFEEIAGQVEAFAGMTYDTVGDAGQLLK
jgi:predicted molibdopterin-dependent oxidoreductase YjgC